MHRTDYVAIAGVLRDVRRSTEDPVALHTLAKIEGGLIGYFAADNERFNPERFMEAVRADE
jgi:hypothetical protein